MAKNYKVNDDGRAPAGLSTGDQVVTGGGTYRITGVNPDGTYQSEKINNTTTKNYSGEYATPGATASGGGSNGSNYSGGSNLYDRDTDYRKLIDSAINSNSTDADWLQSLLNQRMAKEQNPEFAKWADPTYNSQVQNYINNLRLSQTQAPNFDEAMQQVLNAIGPAPSYDRSSYNLANSLAQQFIGMDYNDWLNSDQYNALADRYGRQGKMTMQDILGQISSRTGGLASSYAATAANQQYNEYMAQLEDIARQAWDKERESVYNNVQAAYDISDRDYQRYLDQLANYGDNRSYAYQVLSDAIANSQWNQQWQNTLQQQALENQRYNDETQYSRGQNAMNNARTQIENDFAMGLRMSDLDPALISESGLSTAELAALEKYYADMGTTQNTSTGRSSGGNNGRQNNNSGNNDNNNAGDEDIDSSTGSPEEYREIINRITSGYNKNGEWLNYTVDDIRSRRDQLISAYGEDAYNNLVKIAQMGL